MIYIKNLIRHISRIKIWIFTDSGNMSLSQSIHLNTYH